MLASPKPAEKYGLPSSVARGLKPPRPRPEEPDDALAAVAAVGSVEAAAGAASGGGGIATAVALRCRGSTNSRGWGGGQIDRFWSDLCNREGSNNHNAEPAALCYFG